MDHPPLADRTVSERSRSLRRICTLGLGAGGLALILASAWMPWYHFSRSPFSALPGCSEPAPPILWGAALLTGLALASMAVRSTVIGMGIAVASLLVLMAFGLGTGFISSRPCETIATVPAYGQLVALSGSILAIGATLADWRWNR